jgi:hypothetical protein
MLLVNYLMFHQIPTYATSGVNSDRRAFSHTQCQLNDRVLRAGIQTEEDLSDSDAGVPYQAVFAAFIPARFSPLVSVGSLRFKRGVSPI